ncbi:hypothetical protein GCM10022419_117160 [Nonomuraea rosea]|uniref:histidine kinase n=1 Tax=Nonomuraea rosea TaxID=638574 RepID=A0ABP6ZN24_9ACTN
MVAYRVRVAFFRRGPVRGTLIALLVAYLAYGPIIVVVTRSGAGQIALGLLAAVAALGGCLGGLAERRPGRAAWLLLLGLCGGLALHAIEPYTGLSSCFVVVYAAPFRCRPRVTMAITTLCVVALPLVSYAVGLDLGTTFGLTAGVAYTSVFAFLVAYLSSTKRQAAELAEARAREAVLSERARLAREVHDILAHSQSAQIVYLEGARMLLKGTGDVAAALDRVERAVGLARTGLEETRRALDALRGEDLPLRERLERLASEFRAATGAGCALSVAAELGAPAAEARLALARTAQEALTNVRKHAPGASVTLTLRRVGEWCELEVQDDGGYGGAAQTAGGGGYGLVGMRERAELIGGSLKAGAGTKGFAVVLRVPA